MTPPTNAGQPLPPTPQPQAPQDNGGFIPTANAAAPDAKFTDFVTKAYQAGLNDDEVKQAVDQAIKNGVITDPNAEPQNKTDYL